MELRRLPLDVFRLIAFYSGSIALARLNATLDLSIQRLLQSPNVLSALKILPTFASKPSHLSFLYRSLGMVKHLILEIKDPLNFDDLSFVSRFNALELTLIEANETQDRQRGILSLTALLASANALNTKQILMALGKPDFQGLAPNLQRLDFELTLYGPTRLGNGVNLTEEDLLQVQVAPYEFVLPPSLTSLHFRSVDVTLFTSVINVLPSTLRELTAHTSEIHTTADPVVQASWLRLIFDKAPAIEKLDLSVCFLVAEGVTELPKTLHTLLLSYQLGNVLDALACIGLGSSRIASLLLHEKAFLFQDKNRKPPTISLRTLLPPTLETLHLIDQNIWLDVEGKSTIELATTLTELVLEIPQNVHPVALSNLRTLQHLTILNLSVDSSCTFCLLASFSERAEFGSQVSQIEVAMTSNFYSYDLPRGLTELNMRVLNNISEDVIHSLPPKLVRLTVNHFDLSRHWILAQHLPHCLLHIKQYIRFWASSNGAWLTQGEFEPFWNTHLDFNLWRTAVLQWKARARVVFELSLGAFNEKDDTFAKYPPDVESIKVEDAWDPENLSMGSLLRFNYLRRECRYLTSMSINVGLKDRVTLLLDSNLIPPSLTRLDLHDSLVTLMIDEKCPLRYLTSTRTSVPANGVMRKAPPHLTFLDTPNWTFSATELETWNLKDMERLSMRVSNLEDYKVVDFLTRRVNVKTRLNMKVVLSVNPTGALLPDDGDLALRNVTWNEMYHATLNQLATRLAAPFASEADASPDSSSLNHQESIDTVGSVIDALKLSQATSEICFPQSALIVTLPIKGSWTLLPKPVTASQGTSALVHATELHGASNLNQTWFGPHIVRLELAGVLNPDSFLSYLPESLVNLRLATTSNLSPRANDFKFPLRLTFLLYENQSTSSEVFPFPISSFPSTIEHIGYTCRLPASPHPQDNIKGQIESELPWRLQTHLKSVFFARASDSMTLILKKLDTSKVRLVQNTSSAFIITEMISLMTPPTI